MGLLLQEHTGALLLIVFKHILPKSWTAFLESLVRQFVGV